MKISYFLALTLLLLIPIGVAVTETQTVDVLSSSSDLVVNYTYPESAQVGQQFDVSVNAFASATGLTIEIQPGADWTYIGCTFVGETTAGALTGIKSTRVRLQMDTETCSATLRVNVTLTLGGAAQSQAFITLNVFQGSVKITESPNHIEGFFTDYFLVLLLVVFVNVAFTSRKNATFFSLVGLVVGIFAVTTLPDTLRYAFYPIFGLMLLLLVRLIIDAINQEDVA